MTADDGVPHDVLEENVGRLFDRLKRPGSMPGAARDRILGRLLREASPAPRSTRGGDLARRWARWGGLAAALFVAAALLTGDRPETATSGGRELAGRRVGSGPSESSVDLARVSFAIHLVAAGPGRGVVLASSWQGEESVPVHSERQVSNADVEAARVERTGSGCRVDIRLTEAGSRKLASLTRRHVGERLALVVDGKVAMTPTIRSEITQGAVALTGAFTEARCEEIARGLSARP